MADVTIDGVVEDTEVTGGEKIPVSDGGMPKAVTTDRLKDFVLKRIAALASANKVDTASDGVYLLKGGELKPVSAAVLAAAVMDYAFALAPVETITGNETVSVKDATVKKTLSLDMLKSWLTEGSVTAEDLKLVADSVADKVDKEEGKGLSEKNFSAEDKAKLDGLVSNTQSDWEQMDDTAPDFIKHKPAIPEEVVVDQVLDENSSNAVSNSVVALAIKNSMGNGIQFIQLNDSVFNNENGVVKIFTVVSKHYEPRPVDAETYPLGTVWEYNNRIFILTPSSIVGTNKWLEVMGEELKDTLLGNLDILRETSIRYGENVAEVAPDRPTAGFMSIIRSNSDDSLWLDDGYKGVRKLVFVDAALAQIKDKAVSTVPFVDFGMVENEGYIPSLSGTVQPYPPGTILRSCTAVSTGSGVMNEVYLNIGDGTTFKPYLLARTNQV